MASRLASAASNLALSLAQARYADHAPEFFDEIEGLERTLSAADSQMASRGGRRLTALAGVSISSLMGIVAVSGFGVAALAKSRYGRLFRAIKMGPAAVHVASEAV